MKILTIHADYIEFEVTKKALTSAEDVKKGKKRIEECLVIFTAVEKGDEDHQEAIVQRYIKEIKDIASQLKARTIVLYPYAHLSSELATPSVGEKVMKEAEKIFRQEGEYEVHRAPFGWYKAFTIANKGHPLSELSREFTATKDEKKKEGDVSEALKAEQKMVSYWHILDVKGNLHEISYDREKKQFKGFEFKNLPNLKKFAAYELAKTRVASQEPPHVKLMRKLELVDYEPGSDPGNLRFYPKGRFIKGLIERYVTQKVKAAGGMEIETPIMYDFEHPSLKSYLNRFPARQYSIQTPNKKVFLRFAACFGQFLQMHNAQISYKQLPVWLYELTRYSFRVEQHGELTGLRRLRAFTMPDCHAFCANEEQAKSEMVRRFALAWEIQKGIGLSVPDDLEFAIRVTKEFWEKHHEFIKGLVKKWGKPALVEMWDKRFFYYSMKYEWNFVDALEKASALTTDQIDVENGERYDISYIDEEGKKKHPLILHLSPSGAVERILYALLERAALWETAGKIPTLPLWLAPTQIRLIPVSVENHLDLALKLESKLTKLGMRVDIDDRVESVGKRIRSAEQEWVPYTIVLGEKEAGGNEFVVRVREKGEEITMTGDSLVNQIKEKIKEMPEDTLPLPRMLSKR